MCFITHSETLHQVLSVAERLGEYLPGDRFAATFELQDGLEIEVEFAPDTRTMATLDEAIRRKL